MKVTSRTRKRTAVLGLAALFALCFAGVPLLPHAGAEADAPSEASQAAARLAETKTEPQEPLLTRGNASLFLPETYEQYLGLDSPSYVAMSARHIAVADGMTLYIYDRMEGTYLSYRHTGDTDIYKIQFSEDGRLFFSDVGRLYEYQFGENKARRMTNIDCATFLIDGTDLFTASLSGNQAAIRHYDLGINAAGETTTSNERLIQRENSTATPHMTSEDGVLYCVLNDTTVARYAMQTLAPIETDGETYALLNSSKGHIAGLKFVCAYDGVLYYTVCNETAEEGTNPLPNGLYSNSTDSTAPLVAGDGFGAVSRYGDRIYCVCGNAVREFDPAGAAFTDYEISSSSLSLHRLSGAVDAARAGDLLVVADAGNCRISVTESTHTPLTDADGKPLTGHGGKPLFERKHTVIPCVDGGPFAPERIATDGSVIAVSAGRYIYLYRYGESEPYYRHDAETAPTGLACVYGSVYFVTVHSFGKAEEGAPLISRNAAKTNAALASDLYGDLYVAYADGTAARFTEQNFLDGEASGDDLSFVLPEGFSCLRADFEGNLYCLAGNTVYRNGTERVASLDGDDFVFAGADTLLLPLSYALGFEDDEVYFLFGDYMVKSDADALDIPTLNEISADGVSESVFTPHGKERLLVDIPAGTIAVRTDLEALRNDRPVYFPYSEYYRTSIDERGILLAEQGGYSLVILYGENRTFSANLFRLGGDVVPESEYWTEKNENAYLSSDVSLYYFPCLHAALADSRLTRGTAVHVLGTVSAPEREYALVELVSARAATRGYLPVAYLTDVPPLGAEGSSFEQGWLKPSEEGVLFTADDGSTLLVTARTPARLYGEEGGTYTAQIEVDGTVYTAHGLAASAIDRGESDALRISLIVGLTVLGLVIIGAYLCLLPKKPKNGKKSPRES